MKLFLLFAATVTILLTVKPVETSTNAVKKDNDPACCIKAKCSTKETTDVPEDFFPLQFNPIHI